MGSKRSMGRRLRPRNTCLWIVALCVMILTCLYLLATQKRLNQEIQNSVFLQSAHQKGADLQHAFNRYEQAIYLVQDLLSHAVTDQDGLSEERFHHVMERHLGLGPFRAIMDMGYAQVVSDPPSEPGKTETLPRSLRVQFRRCRWGLRDVGEDLLASPYRQEILKSARRNQPYLSNLKIYRDEKRRPMTSYRGIRLYLPIYRLQSTDMDKQLWHPIVSGTWAGMLYVTLNPEQLVWTIDSNQKSLTDVELFQGRTTAEAARLRGFPTSARGKPRKRMAVPSDTNPMHDLQDLEFAGNIWRARIYATQAFHPPTLPIPLSLFWGVSVCAVIGFMLLVYRGPSKILSPQGGSNRQNAIPISRKPSGIKPGIPYYTGMGWPLVLGLLGTAVSLYLYDASKSRSLQLDRQQFEMRSDDMWQRLETRIERYEQSLENIRNRIEFLLALEDISLQDHWKKRLGLRTHLPGVLEVGMAKVMTQEAYAQQHEALSEVTQQSLPASIPTPHGIIILDDTNVIDPTFSRRGDNLYSFQPGEILAPVLAARDDIPRISIPMDIPFGAPSTSRRCFRMFLPMTASKDKSQRSPYQLGPKSSRPWGFLYATFDLQKMMPSIFGKHALDVDMEIFGANIPTPKYRLGHLKNPSTSESQDTSNGSSHPIPSLTRQITTSQYLQPWLIHFKTTQFFEAQSNRRQAAKVLWIGLGLTACLTGLFGQQARARVVANHLIAELRTTESELREEIDARQQLGRDIHDEGIQSLYAVSIGLKRLLQTDKAAAPNAHNKSSHAAPEFVTQALEIIGNLTSELRQMAWRTTETERVMDRDVASGLDEILKDAQWAYGIKTTLKIDPDLQPLPKHLSQEILRITKEAVSNAARHGQPKHIQVNLTVSQQQLHLTIEDDGQGFDPATALETGEGLRNMQKRAKRIQGHLEINATPGTGSLIRVRFPWSEEKGSTTQ